MSDHELISTARLTDDATAHLFVRRAGGRWYVVRGIQDAYAAQLKLDHLGFDRFVANYGQLHDTPPEPTK